MLSRRKCFEKRQDKLALGDGWTGKICFEDEKQAKYHLEWLESHNQDREYVLAAAWPKTVAEDLNDDISHLM